jgi:signal transduction histidine kinase
MNNRTCKAPDDSGHGWRWGALATGMVLGSCAWKWWRVTTGEAVEEAARDRQALIARAERLDHDLRTPVGTLAAAVELLRAEPPGSAMASETLDVIERQVARMRVLVQEMNDFSRALGR